MFPDTYSIFLFSFLLNINIESIDIGPTLPININIISITFEINSKLLTSTTDNPVAEKAESS